MLHSQHSVSHSTLETFIANCVTMARSVASPNHDAGADIPATDLVHDVLHGLRREVTTDQQIKGAYDAGEMCMHMDIYSTRSAGHS